MLKRLDELKYRVKAHSRAERGSSSPRRTHEIEIEADDPSHAARLAAKQIGYDRHTIIRKINPASDAPHREEPRKRTEIIQKGKLTQHARAVFSKKAVDQYDGERGVEPKKAMPFTRHEPKLTAKPRPEPVKRTKKAKSKWKFAKTSKGKLVRQVIKPKQYKIVKTPRGWVRRAKKVNEMQDMNEGVGYHDWEVKMHKTFDRKGPHRLLKVSARNRQHASMPHREEAEMNEAKRISYDDVSKWAAHAERVSRAHEKKGHETSDTHDRHEIISSHHTDSDDLYGKVHAHWDHQKGRGWVKEEAEMNESSFRSMIRTHVRAAGIQSRQFHALNDPSLDPEEKRGALKRLHRQMRYARKKTDAYADKDFGTRHESVDEATLGGAKYKGKNNPNQRRTSASYARKADHHDHAEWMHDRLELKARLNRDKAKAVKHDHKSHRHHQAAAAAFSLSREETEIDEASRTKLARYIGKALDDAGMSAAEYGKKALSDDPRGIKSASLHLKNYKKRHRGINLAARKLDGHAGVAVNAREEAELTELTGKGKLKSLVRYHASSAKAHDSAADKIYAKDRAISSRKRVLDHEDSAYDHKVNRDRARELLKKRRNEEVVNELSKGTLARYVSAASMDKSFHASDIATDNTAGMMGARRVPKKDFDGYMRKHLNRSGGIQTAAMKLGAMTKDKHKRGRDSWIKVPASEETDFLNRHEKRIAKKAAQDVAKKNKKHPTLSLAYKLQAKNFDYDPLKKKGND